MSKHFVVCQKRIFLSATRALFLPRDKKIYEFSRYIVDMFYDPYDVRNPMVLISGQSEACIVVRGRKNEFWLILSK